MNKIFIKIKDFYQCFLKLIKRDEKVKVSFEIKKDLLEKGFHDDVYKMKRSYYHTKKGLYPKYPFEREDEISFDDYFVAFLTKVRILYRFFNNIVTKEGNKEAKAKDYIDNWKIRKPSKKMKFLYKQINAHVSHLDYSRVETNHLINKRDIMFKNFREITIIFLKDLQKTKYQSEILEKLLKELEEDARSNP